MSHFDAQQLCLCCAGRCHRRSSSKRPGRALTARASSTCSGAGDATTRRKPLSPSALTTQPFSRARLRARAAARITGCAGSDEHQLGRMPGRPAPHASQAAGAPAALVTGQAARSLEGTGSAPVCVFLAVHGPYELLGVFKRRVVRGDRRLREQRHHLHGPAQIPRTDVLRGASSTRGPSPCMTGKACIEHHPLKREQVRASLESLGFVARSDRRSHQAHCR